MCSSVYCFSAAHCVNGKLSTEIFKPRDFTVIFGAHQLSSSHEIGRYELTPRRIIIHEDWDVNSLQYDADLALLRFKRESIIFNLSVQPICLWSSSTMPSVTEGIVAGWGKSEERDQEDRPKMVRVKIQSNGKCLPGQGELATYASERTFCAGLRNGSGVCNGDSGGGLFIAVNNVYYLKGIISSSLIANITECNTFQNSIYTDVLQFKDWIFEEIGLSP